MLTGLNMGKYLLFISLFFSVPAVAQDSTAHKYGNAPLSVVHSTFKVTEPQKLPANLYTQHLGFFCKQELNMTRKSIPVHFRLGSMEQVNYLERKPGYLYDLKNR